MVNADWEWQYWMERFKNAVEGEEVKDLLMFCVRLVYASHLENVVHRNEYYAEIIFWDPDNPFTPDPPGEWYYDPVRGWTDPTEHNHPVLPVEGGT